ncbi:MAG: tRNA (adenosine(37)-N6)-dimethylallyltransferase MiaA [Planctomycetota bacterium]|nr:MAG: tRNA (adenosine(37)-N6)-dimethylallyltransferase MiaA [Planctomycetota bacterium]
MVVRSPRGGMIARCVAHRQTRQRRRCLRCCLALGRSCRLPWAAVSPGVPPMQTSRTPRLFIVGPTASGKGRLAVEIARRTGGEILSCDSMKVYRGMEIGTATPPAEARAGQRFHLVGIREPHEPMSAAIYCRLAEACEREVRARGAVPIYCGGTALYVRALTEGLFEGVQADPALRARLREQAQREGPAALHARLAALDPETARRLHPNDLRRVIRALEVHERTGVPISRLQRQWARTPRPDRVLVGIRWPRELLYERIDRRVERMIEAGWIEEVERLLARPEGLGPQAAQAIGYRTIADWIRGGRREPLEQIVARIQRDTRRFSRRQRTFFAHFPDLHWYDVGPETSWPALAERVIRDWPRAFERAPSPARS